VIDDPAEALRAVENLRATGFSEEDIRLFLSQEVVDRDRAIMSYRSVLQNMIYTVANISDDAAMAREYLDEARQGHQLLVVHAPEVERATQASASVERHHAHRVRYYGRWVVRDVGSTDDERRHELRAGAG